MSTSTMNKSVEATMTYDDKEWRNEAHQNFYLKFWGASDELESRDQEYSINDVYKEIAHVLSDEELWEYCTDKAHEDASSAAWEGINIDVRQLTQDFFDAKKEKIDQWRK